MATTKPIPNLAPDLRPALERLGFVVQLVESATQTLLMAAWMSEERHTYQLLYIHARPVEGEQLSYANLALIGRRGAQDLVTDTHVRKVAEVRHLLLHNRRYKAARLAALAAGTLLPA